MSDKPRLDRAIKVARQNRYLQQFGQGRMFRAGHDSHVHNGKTACTHTICQYLALLWNSQVLTLNQVNEMAGMPPNARNENGDPRGMLASELKTFFRNAGIPMVVKFDRRFEDLLSASERGPVFYGMRYGSAPRRMGSGPSENGFARPFPPRRRGATQNGIPKTRHAVLMLGFLERRDAAGHVIATNVYRKEPNHGSPNRPEDPPFDKIFAHQAKREYNDYRDRLGMHLYAAWPRKGTGSPV